MMLMLTLQYFVLFLFDICEIIQMDLEITFLLVLQVIVLLYKNEESAKWLVTLSVL